MLTDFHGLIIFIRAALAGFLVTVGSFLFDTSINRLQILSVREGQK